MDPNSENVITGLVVLVAFLVPLIITIVIVAAVGLVIVRFLGARRGEKVWSVAVAPALLMPGSGGAVTARLTPMKPLTHDGIRATVTCVESYVYETSETDREGHTRTVRHTGTEKLHDRTFELAPAGTIGPEGAEWRFGVEIPALAAPTYGGETLRVAWTVRVFANVNGPDIARETELPVGAPVERMSAGVIDLEAGAALLEFTLADGTIEIEPLPFDLAATGSATLRFPAPPSTARGVRLGIYSSAEVRVGGGVDSTMAVWESTLAPASLATGNTKIALDGPFSALPDVDTPHGRARAWLVVTYDIPGRPDEVRKRPIALARGTMNGPVRWDSAPMG